MWANTALGSTGSGGSIDIETGELSIADGGRISVSSRGAGNGGELFVSSNVFNLDNGLIIATTPLGEGGRITLQVPQINLTNSQITATASNNANGGEITIADLNGEGFSDWVLLQDSSQIVAQAEEGVGGNITIQTRGIFECGDCQISATSQIGEDGEVRIITPAESNFELFELPEDVSNPEEIVTKTCVGEKGSSNSQFIITGRGGLPPRPTDVQAPEDLVRFNPPATRRETPSTAWENPPQQLVEATGWYRRSDGVVVLTADRPNTNSQPWHSASCESNDE